MKSKSCSLVINPTCTWIYIFLVSSCPTCVNNRRLPVSNEFCIDFVLFPDQDSVLQVLPTGFRLATLAPLLSAFVLIRWILNLCQSQSMEAIRRKKKKLKVIKITHFHRNRLTTFGGGRFCFLWYFWGLVLSYNGHWRRRWRLSFCGDLCFCYGYFTLCSNRRLLCFCWF